LFLQQALVLQQDILYVDKNLLEKEELVHALYKPERSEQGFCPALY
jgi:hypothetical protein